jgi:hypothetical protein
LLEQAMNSFVRLFLLTGLTLAAAVSAVRAQTPGKLDLEAAEHAIAKLIGASVFARDAEIGAVSIDENGKIDAIRVRTSSPLGFGERIVEIPASAFSVLRGIVVLELTPEQVNQFPDADSADDITRPTDR